MTFDLERRIFVGARHVIVHEGAGEDLPRFVHDYSLAENLCDSLHDAAMQLPLEQERIHDRTDIVYRKIA